MKKITIFYADDDEDDLMFFEEAVTSISQSDQDAIDLYLLKNGEHLIDSLHTKADEEAAVVFLDLNMPLKSGFELLEEIRSNPKIKNIPIIMYSTSSSERNMSLSRKLGANYYAVKPNSFDELIKIISSAVKIDWKSHASDNSNFLFNNIA